MSLLEVIKAARKLRLLREGVHPNPGPPNKHRTHAPKKKKEGLAKRKEKEDQDLKLASYNLGFSLEDKLVRMSLEDVLDHEGVDIAALQEVSVGKLKKMSFDGDKYAFYVSKGTATCKPVGFAVKRTLIALFGAPTIDCFGPRLALLRWRRLGLHYLCGYAPVRSRQRVVSETVAESPAEAERRTFWNQLTAVYADSKRENATTFVAGDFNCELSRDDTAEDIHTVPEDNADRLCELMRHQQLAVGNWCGVREQPQCFTFLGMGMAEPALLDYILVPEARYKHISSFYTCDKNKFLRKHTFHKMLVLRIRLHRSRIDRKRGRELVGANEPQFEKAQCTSVDDRYQKFAARVRDMQKKGEVVVLPTIDYEFMSDYTGTLIAQLDMAKTESPVCHATVDALMMCVKQSREEDKKRAIRDFAEAIAETFASPNRADVYRMLNHITRAKGCLKAHVRDHSKLQLLDHYMKLLGDAPEYPDFPYLDKQQEPQVLPRVSAVQGPTTVLFTDGSFFEEKNIAGWSFVDVRNHCARCGSLPRPDDFMTRSSRMTKAEFHCAFAEAYAVLEGLRAYSDYNMRFCVDSQSTIDTFNALPYLQQSDFREVPFAHVWKEIFVLSRDRAVYCEKVEAHSNLEHNEQADVLAKFGASLAEGTARSVQCPQGTWWGQLNARLEVTAGGFSSILVALWNAELVTWPHVASLTFLPPRHTNELVPRAANDEVPTRSEVWHAILSLTNVTPGVDGILMKMCKDEEVFDEIFLLIEEIWKTGVVPAEWRQSVMVSLKKNAHKDLGPENCRGISLTSIPSRILTRIILERGAGAGIHGEQIGFRRAQGAPQAQLIVRQALRAANLGKTPMILTFVDLVKAFDQLDRKKLPEVLRRYGYGENASRLMQTMWDAEVSLKYPDGTYSKSFRTKTGTKQGDVCSPFIFNLYMDLAIREILPMLSGATLGGASGVDVLKLIMYADDIVLFAASSEEATANLALLELALKPTGLKINVSKTKTLHAMCPASPRQDTVVGYEHRIRKKGKHREQHLDAGVTIIRYVKEGGVTRGKLLMSTAHNKARCPHETCPFVATYGTRENMDCLVGHLKSRHKVEAIDITVQPGDLMGRSDQDPNRGIDVAPSVARRSDGYVSFVHLGGKYVERVLMIKYLGSMVSENGSLEDEIRNRIGAAQGAFHKFPRELWASVSMPLYVKWELYKHLVMTRMVYGAEAWAPTEADAEKLEGVYIKHLRVLTGLSTVCENLGDETVAIITPSRSRVTEVMSEPRISDILRTCRLRLYGQIKRAGPFSLIHKWAYAEPVATEVAPRGPRMAAWHTLVVADLYALGVNDTTSSFNRKKWKEVIAYTPRGPQKMKPEEGAWM